MTIKKLLLLKACCLFDSIRLAVLYLCLFTTSKKIKHLNFHFGGNIINGPAHINLFYIYVLKLIYNLAFFSLSPEVIYVSAAGSMLCQIINSLLLLPVSVARPVLSHLLDLLPPLDRLNRLLPAAAPLEDQELQWPLHGEH